MKSKFLLPAKFKKIGWVILIPSSILGLVELFIDMEPEFLDVQVLAVDIFPFLGPPQKLFYFTPHNLANEILGTLIIVGGLMVAFSREVDEDELISSMRLECLVWAICWNYGILIVAFFLFYGPQFLWIMIFNLFTPLILFIIRFNWLVGRFRKTFANEEQH